MGVGQRLTGLDPEPVHDLPGTCHHGLSGRHPGQEEMGVEPLADPLGRDPAGERDEFAGLKFEARLMERLTPSGTRRKQASEALGVALSGGAARAAGEQNAGLLEEFSQGRCPVRILEARVVPVEAPPGEDVGARGEIDSSRAPDQ